MFFWLPLDGRSRWHRRNQKKWLKEQWFASHIGQDGRIGCISLVMGFPWNMSWNFSTGIGQLNGDRHWWLTLYIELKTIFSLFASSGHNSTQWGQVFLLSETAVALIIKKTVPDLIYCQYEQDANLFFSTLALYWHNGGMIIRFSRDREAILWFKKVNQ